MVLLSQTVLTLEEVSFIVGRSNDPIHVISSPNDLIHVISSRRIDLSSEVVRIIVLSH